jgi:hypothetical protein
LNVHHRRPGDHTQLVTLCAGCHARVHRSRILGRWLPEILVVLWREWHPDAVEQLQLPIELSAAPPSGAGWQIFSGFPARTVAGQLPEDESSGGGKYSRVFFPGYGQDTAKIRTLRNKVRYLSILRADRTRIRRTTYSRPCSSALLIHQDLSALAGPAVALCTNFARIQSVPEEAILAEVLEVNVNDASVAQKLGFLGSPSVRVNGLDVEPERRTARDYEMMCRTYVVNGRREGLPSCEMLRQAVREVLSGINNLDSGQGGSRPSKGPSSLFAAGSVFFRDYRQFLLHPSDRLRPDWFFDPGSVGTVRCLEAVSACPHFWTPWTGLLLRLSAEKGVVRAGHRLQDARDKRCGTPDALAGSGRSYFVRGVSILLGAGGRVSAVTLFHRSGKVERTGARYRPEE